MSVRTLVSALAGAVLGGILVWFIQTGSVRIHPTNINMSYPELAAVLLTAVGVIVATLGGVLALAAIWGFTQLKRDAVSVAEAAALKEIREQIENGPLKDYIHAEIEQMINNEIDSERMDRRIKGRIDAISFGNPAKDRLLEDDQ